MPSVDTAVEAWSVDEISGTQTSVWSMIMALIELVLSVGWPNARQCRLDARECWADRRENERVAIVAVGVDRAEMLRLLSVHDCDGMN